MTEVTFAILLAIPPQLGKPGTCLIGNTGLILLILTGLTAMYSVVMFIASAEERRVVRL